MNDGPRIPVARIDPGFPWCNRLASAWLLLLLPALSFLPGVRLTAATLPSSNFVETTIPSPSGGNWNEAVGLSFEDNGRMYVWERAGRVWIREYGASTFSQLIDISEEVGGWRDFGLLGFTLDPNFRSNGYIYLMYVVDRHHLLYSGTGSYNSSSNWYFQATIGRITRYTARSSDGFTSVDPLSRRVLLGENKETGFPILYESHGVGSLVVGTDGTLLASCGDGASYSSVDVGNASETYYLQALADGIIKPKENVGAYRAQLVDSLIGKIVRIDPATGDGVPSNPFYDPTNPRSAKSRVWALGVRNPCRMTLRPGTGSHIRSDANPGVLYVGDVGFNTWEDLNVCTGPGQNFGWPAFEGVEAHSGYYGSNVPNLDAPNPLYPASGCSQYFYFRDLIKQNTTVAANKPPFNNPCNAAQKIPSTIPQFLHTPPAIDWKHSSGPARTWIYNSSGVATNITIGAAGSPVSGTPYPGNCSIGGVWYSGNDFPAQYKNTYFHADYGANWIKNFVFDANDKPVAVRDFLSGGGGVVAVATHPIDGGLYYISWSTMVRKITYTPSGNQPPTAVASSDKQYGPGPLVVQFTGSASTDPEGQPITYSWNFGDGTPNSAAPNPTHTFNATPGVPTPYTVTLTVTDSVGQTSMATVLVSINNTPPLVSITSPLNGTQYPLTGDTIYNLTANVSDAEHPDSQLKYEWQTFLHHNNHEHQEPVDTNHVTTAVISPLGCDGNTYYYRIVLKVTDAAGLSAQSEVDLYPDCPNQPPVASFSASPSTGNPPLLVSFDARSSNDPDNDPLTFSWDFGDGVTDSGQTPSHTYTSAGPYTATLTVTDTGSLTDTASSTISVVSLPPPGLEGTYFDNIDLTNPTLTRNDTTINFDWGTGSPDPSVGPDTFSVRWIGQVQPAYSETYTFYTTSDDGIRLWVNNQLVIDSWIDQSPTEHSGAIALSAGAKYDMKIEYYENGGGAVAKLSWSSSSQPKQIIPAGRLFPPPPPNTPPTISDIANQTINEDGATGALSVTVGDSETPVGTLTLDKGTSNTALVPLANIVFGGSGASRTVTVTPASNQFGTATITITVSDGSLTASDSFVLTVNSVNDPPTISDIPNQVINENTSTGPLGFAVGDVETAAGSLTLAKGSSNPSLVPAGNIVFGGSGAARTVTVTPAPNQFGVATITVTVSDGSMTTNDTFLLTVNQVNAPPVAGPDSIARYADQGVKVLRSVLLGNDSDPDGDTVTFASVNSPSPAGGIVVAQGAWLRYTPPAGYTNSDTFGYVVSDGHGGNATGTVSVGIQVDNDPTSNVAVDDLGNGSFHINGAGIPGRSYRLQYTGNLASPNWQTLATQTCNSFGILEYLDSPGVGAPTRYYRFVSP